MKTKFINKFSLFAILLILFTNCGNRTINGIEVSELLLIVSKQQNINYCKLVYEATEGNQNSIKQLALLEINDGAGYDHGEVIVNLIEIIGEGKFLHSIGAIRDKEKWLIIGYIEVGLEYGYHPNLQTESFKEAFPSIYDFLKN